MSETAPDRQPWADLKSGGGIGSTTGTTRGERQRAAAKKNQEEGVIQRWGNPSLRWSGVKGRSGAS